MVSFVVKCDWIEVQQLTLVYGSGNLLYPGWKVDGDCLRQGLLRSVLRGMLTLSPILAYVGRCI